MSQSTHRSVDAEAEECCANRVRLERECAAAIAENELLKKDVLAASAELLVDLPAPGTDMARVMRANALMRRERDATRKENQRLRQLLLQRVTVEHGWHDNPDNHTLQATFFFGSIDPRPLIQWDAHGHATLTQQAIDTILAESAQ